MQFKCFAQIENSIVINVIVARQDFVDAIKGTWIETKPDGSQRMNYAGIGMSYDADRDAFIAPKANCHAEEVLDEATCRWNCTNEEHNIELGEI